MLALWPSVYPADTILNVFTVNGAPAAYNKNLGTGIGTAASGTSSSLQLAYGRESWGLAVIYTYLQPETSFVPGTTPFTHSAIDHNGNSRTNAFALSGYL